MELEKDERVYGGHDAAVRADMPAQGARALAGDPQAVHRRSPTSPRSAAGRCMSMLMSAVPNNELRNGYHVQFVDEIRHTGHADGARALVRPERPRPGRLEPRAARRSRARCCTNPGLNMLSPLHRRRPDPVRVHAPGRGRDGVHQRRVRRHPRRRRPQRRLHPADDVPERPVRRGAPHLQRLRDAADRPPGRPQRAADRARPAAGVLDQPRVHRRLQRDGDRVLLPRPLRSRVASWTSGTAGSATTGTAPTS